MKGLAIAAAAVSIAAVTSGCYSRTREVVVTEPPQRVNVHYVERMHPASAPVAPVVTGVDNDSDNPTIFAARVRQRMDRIARGVQEDVNDGDLAPTAMDEVQRQRAYVEQLLSQYSADGRMHDEERDQVERAVSNMEEIKDRHEPRRGAVGGGPYYYRTP